MAMEDQQELDMDIPSHFLCPISLQLMRDPVTVSTGITYDRPTIQHWLSTNHNKKNRSATAAAAVCPVTKQPLSGPADLTPNHTLRRLIQSWCIVNGVDRIPTPKTPINISNLISAADRSPDHISDTLRRLKSLSLADRSSLRSTGAVPFLSSQLILSSDRNDAVETLSILSEIEASEDELKSVMTSTNGELLVDRLTWFLTDCDDSESRCNSIKLLRSLYSVADSNQLTTVKTELFTETVKLLRDRHNGTKWALKLLFGISPWGRNRVKAVNAGAVEALIEILLDVGLEQKRVCELAMALLDQLCGCAEGRAGLWGHGAGLAVVSKRILRVSNVVTDRAVRVIGSVSRHSANGVVLGEMLQVGVVAKLCLVVQVECSLKTKERAKEILSAHSKVWKNSPCVPSNLLRSFPS